MRRLAVWSPLALVTALLLLQGLAGDRLPFQALEGQTVNWRFLMRGPVTPDPAVAILAIDSKTIERVGRWPLPRPVIGQAVENLVKAGAAVVALDLILAEGTDDNAIDARFAERLAAVPGLVLPVAFSFDEALPLSPPKMARLASGALKVVIEGEDAGDARLPSPRGAMIPPSAGERAALGHVNVVLDSDGALRRIDPVIDFNGGSYPMLAVTAVRLLAGDALDTLVYEKGRRLVLSGHEIAVALDGTVALNFYGPAGSLPTFSMSDLLDGKLAPDALRGRIVFVGATAAGVGDRYATPFSPSLPGVEVLATATANILEGRLLMADEISRLADVAATLLLGLLTALLCHKLRPAFGFALAALIAGLWWALAQALFTAEGWLLNLTFPTLAVALSAALMMSLRIREEQRLHRTAAGHAANLSRRLSPVVAGEVARDAGYGETNRRQPAAVLFVDVAGFTRIAEAIGAEATVPLLRDFHRRIEQVAASHSGMIEKFMGDGAMVIFGLPEARLQDAVNALACARSLSEAPGEIVALPASEGAPMPVRLDVRCGLHYGEVVIANLGGDRHVQLTASGDVVNTASRLESLTRDLAASVAISASVYEMVKAQGCENLLAGFQAMASQPIRGRAAALSLHVLPLPTENGRGNSA